MNTTSSVSQTQQIGEISECFVKDLKINTASDLSENLIYKIFNHLSVFEMLTAGGVNKLWNRVSSETINKNLILSVSDCQKNLKILATTTDNTNLFNFASELEKLKEGTLKKITGMQRSGIERLKEKLHYLNAPLLFKNLIDVVLIVKKNKIFKANQFPRHELLRTSLMLNEIELAKSIAGSMPEECRKLTQADELIHFSSLISRNQLDEARNVANDMPTSHNWVKSVEAEKIVQYLLLRHELEDAIETANNIPKESIKISAINDIADYLISQNNLTAIEIANKDLRNRVLKTVADRLTSQDRLEEAETVFDEMEDRDYDTMVNSRFLHKEDKMYMKSLQKKIQMKARQIEMMEREIDIRNREIDIRDREIQMQKQELARQQFIANNK